MKTVRKQGTWGSDQRDSVSLKKGKHLGNDPLYWLCCEVDHYPLARQYMTIQKKNTKYHPWLYVTKNKVLDIVAEASKLFLEAK